MTRLRSLGHTRRRFYPRIHDRGIPASEWLADYFHAYVERDVREVIQISDARSFERFVRLAAAAIRRDPPLYFWRDATGHEIDILIDAGGWLVPVEVKSGRTVTADAVDTLAWWTSIASNPNQGGILVHGGEESFDFKGFRVLPWFLR
ncbi:MAG: DUF4143 domain-containing protein [Deltaproteobacteria bacterium]|nr:DUF4143 domain-containing protein [Deltaproteobacteria bacterium]MDE0343268.1 DUF4143 domain-containing protein [Deltaproteobacteria bacterium]